MTKVLAVIAVLAVLVLIIGGMSVMGADSAADTAQAVATYKVAEVAATQATNQMVQTITTVLIIGAVLTAVVVAVVLAAVVYVKRRLLTPIAQQTPRRWAPGPNAGWKRLDDQPARPQLDPGQAVNQAMTLMMLQMMQQNSLPKAPPVSTLAAPRDDEPKSGVPWW